MITEKDFDRINHVLEDEIIETKIGFSTYDSIYDIYYKIKIVGTKKMISVGDYYDYLKIDIEIIDGNETLLKFGKIAFLFQPEAEKESILPIVKQYHNLHRMERDIENILSYFSESNTIRVMINNIEMTEELKERIKNIKDKKIDEYIEKYG